jgi:hypothetical protein
MEHILKHKICYKPAELPTEKQATETKASTYKKPTQPKEIR